MEDEAATPPDLPTQRSPSQTHVAPSAGETTSNPPTRAVDTPRGPARGQTIGRYVILSRLGAGPSGVVFAAYDPDLHRKVTIKLLLPRGGDPSTAQARLLRAAQVLAKLNHPNVVAIHDVGVHQARVFAAMEFVKGTTLDRWMTHRHPWREILRVFEAAGRGLQAAHAVGLIHGDFRPAHVLLGDDGKVLVTEFGLDSGGEGLEMAPERAVERTGALASIAPERLTGSAATVKSDQFNYCAALYEALTGEGPTGGEIQAGLAAAVTEGKHVDTARTNAPRWLHRLVARGLEVDPSRRHEDMSALLSALTAGETRARRSLGLASAGLLSLAIAGVVAARAIDERQRSMACQADGAVVEAIWNDRQRAAVRTGLSATGVVHAEATAEKVMPWLDQQALAWRAARVEACMRAEVRREWDDALHDRAQWCLEEGRHELRAVVSRLREADTATVNNAVTAVAGLRNVTECLDEIKLGTQPPPELGRRSAVEDVRATLSDVEARLATADYEGGLALAQSTLERAEEVSWPPQVATARLRVGQFQDKRGAYREAEVILEQAYFEAAKAGASEQAFRAAVALTAVVGYRLQRPQDGKRWYALAEAKRSGQPADLGLREALGLSALASVHHAAGQYDAAYTLFQRALRLREDALGSHHPEVAANLSNLGSVHFERGEYDDAVALHERALALQERSLGTEHPRLSDTLNNLAMAQFGRRETEEALVLFERALALQEKTLGREHPKLANTLNNLGNIRIVRGEYEEAIRLLERSLAIHEKTLGAEHPNVAMGMHNLASLHQRRGAYDEAERLHEAALAIRQRALGPDHPDLASSLSGLADLNVARGQHDKALALYERALALEEATLGQAHPNVAGTLEAIAHIRLQRREYDRAAELYGRALAIKEKALGTEHRVVASAVLGLSRVALAQGRTKDAVTAAERALVLRSTSGAPPAALAEARYVLAQALVDDTESRGRALELAEQAREGYRGEAQPAASASGLAEVEAWLTAHR